MAGTGIPNNRNFLIYLVFQPPSCAQCVPVPAAQGKSPCAGVAANHRAESRAASARTTNVRDPSKPRSSSVRRAGDSARRRRAAEPVTSIRDK
jgi:hypothetical protein